MIDRAVLPSLWMCVLLVTASLWMMRLHIRTWREARAEESREAHELNYRRRQFHRRMQTSGILGLLGIAILVGYFVAPPLPIVVVAVYWASVLLMVAWMLVLACFDAVSTQMYFNRVQRRNESQQALLEAKLSRIQKEALAEGTTSKKEPAD
jgi:Na+/H+ antiporter NhaD/arsenite permease-like protein